MPQNRSRARLLLPMTDPDPLCALRTEIADRLCAKKMPVVLPSTLVREVHPYSIPSRVNVLG